MSANKDRVEPEIAIPSQEDLDAAGMSQAPDDGVNDLSLDDVVPGLEDEIAAQQGSEMDEMAELIARLEAERADFKDKWTRSLAEAENVRRRAERDRKDAETYAGTKLARDLLSVYDNLDRALKAADDSLREEASAFIEGVELTQRELLNAFTKHKIEKVRPELGEKFDPNRHQAMFEAPVPGAEPGTVMEAMQDGFVIADRLLRPALVGVAKAMPQSDAASAGKEPAADPDQDQGAGSSEG